jgi:hypothetical protein
MVYSVPVILSIDNTYPLLYMWLCLILESTSVPTFFRLVGTVYAMDSICSLEGGPLDPISHFSISLK